MKNGFFYSVHGFTLQSEIECPELLPGRGGTPDIIVRYGALGHIALDEDHPWRSARIGSRHLFLNIKGVGRFFVRDGCEIVVDPAPGAEKKMIRLFLLGSALGCIVHQRGLLPLHANAFLHAGQAVLVLAHSGTGKSTLAAAMRNSGCKILADDVCAVRVVPGEKPLLYPGVPQIKLWKDAAEHLGEDIGTMQQVMHNEEKYALPLAEPFCDRSATIKALYILNASEGMTLEIVDMAQIEKVDELRNHTYRKGMVAKLGIEAENLKSCAILANSVPMRRIRRPKSRFLLNELADLLENDLP